MTTRKPKISQDSIHVLELMLRTKQAQIEALSKESNPRARMNRYIAEEQEKALSEAIGALTGGKHD